MDLVEKNLLYMSTIGVEQWKENLDLNPETDDES